MCCTIKTLLYIYDMSNAQHNNAMSNATNHGPKFGHQYTEGLTITKILDECQTIAFDNNCNAEGDAIYKNGTLYRGREAWDARSRYADVRASVRHMKKVYRAAFWAGSNDCLRIQQLVTDLTHRIESKQI